MDTEGRESNICDEILDLVENSSINDTDPDVERLSESGKITSTGFCVKELEEEKNPEIPDDRINNR
jgi:hypothetical protein